MSPSARYWPGKTKWLPVKAELLPAPYFHVVSNSARELKPAALPVWKPDRVYDALFPQPWSVIGSFCRRSRPPGSAHRDDRRAAHLGSEPLPASHLHCIIARRGHHRCRVLEERPPKGSSSGLVKARGQGDAGAAMVAALAQAASRGRSAALPAALYKALGGCTPSGPCRSRCDRLPGPIHPQDRHQQSPALSVDKDRVRFATRDYRDGNKVMELAPREFIRRFAQHPAQGFVRIQHDGIPPAAEGREHPADHTRAAAGKTTTDPAHPAAKPLPKRSLLQKV